MSSMSKFLPWQGTWAPGPKWVAIARSVPEEQAPVWFSRFGSAHLPTHGQDRIGGHSRGDVDRIQESQAGVNRELLAKGAEIGDRLVRGVTEGEERGVRRGHPMAQSRPMA